MSDESADERSWRIGDLAAEAGLTVRALHHYDHIGLLRPSRHTEAGHRRYTTEDVTRLYRINLLRGLGLPLDQIGAALDDPEWRLGAAMRRQLDDTRRRAEVARRLSERLERMIGAVDTSEHLTPDDLFTTLEEMTMLSTPARSATTLLVYDDIAVAHDYLTRVFGLTAGPLETDAAGRAVHGEVRAGDQVIWLHRSAEDYRSPQQTGAVTGMTVVVVDDLEAHYQRAKTAGAVIAEKPVDQDYGVREYGARDLEGHLWFFHQPLDQ